MVRRGQGVAVSTGVTGDVQYYNQTAVKENTSMR